MGPAREGVVVTPISRHVFRAPGITTNLCGEGTLEPAFDDGG